VIAPFPERDWKYLRTIKDELLADLCSRILAKTNEISASEKGSAHERYLALYRYVRDADKTVAECFNDWSRSNISPMIISLRRHRLLTDEHVRQLSPRTQEWLQQAEEALLH
jgi:hypothetical protein